MPDNPDVYAFLTGAQYLAYMADMFSVPADARRERIERLTGLLGIADRLGEPVSAYSHGMRQKLVLTGAFLHEPKLLVLDEPFVGLDPEAAYHLRALMRELTDTGSAIFFSSHVLDVVEKLRDEVAIIRAGRIVRHGATDEVCGDANLEDVFLELARSAGRVGTAESAHDDARSPRYDWASEYEPVKRSVAVMGCVFAGFTATATGIVATLAAGSAGALTSLGMAAVVALAAALCAPSALRTDLCD